MCCYPQEDFSFRFQERVFLTRRLTRCYNLGYNTEFDFASIWEALKELRRQNFASS
jgi:hypothetical protein